MHFTWGMYCNTAYEVSRSIKVHLVCIMLCLWNERSMGLRSFKLHLGGFSPNFIYCMETWRMKQTQKQKRVFTIFPEVSWFWQIFQYITCTLAYLWILNKNSRSAELNLYALNYWYCASLNISESTFNFIRVMFLFSNRVYLTCFEHSMVEILN